MKSIDELIRTRRTLKVLGDVNRPLPVEGQREQIEEMLETASWAPFHYPCAKEHREQLGSMVPWRMHALDAQGCRDLLIVLTDAGVAGGKISQMLATATAMVQVTWLPEGDAEGGEFVGSLKNMEHIAAAAAAVQNLLLLATERGFENYWSSGGVLRERVAWEAMQIPEKEVLLGSIFLFPRELENVVTATGKLRDQKGELQEWMRWVEPVDTQG